MTAYLQALISLPVIRHSGERLSHEEVVNQLDRDTVSYGVSLGAYDGFNELLHIAVKVEVARYEAAVAWLHDLLWGSVFDKDRFVRLVSVVYQS